MSDITIGPDAFVASIKSEVQKLAEVRRDLAAINDQIAEKLQDPELVSLQQQAVGLAARDREYRESILEKGKVYFSLTLGKKPHPAVTITETTKLELVDQRAATQHVKERLPEFAVIDWDGLGKYALKVLNTPAALPFYKASIKVGVKIKTDLSDFVA